MKKHHFSQKEEDVVREADEESAGTLTVTLCCRWVMTGLGSGVTDTQLPLEQREDCFYDRRIKNEIRSLEYRQVISPN